MSKRFVAIATLRRGALPVHERLDRANEAAARRGLSEEWNREVRSEFELAMLGPRVVWAPGFEVEKKRPIHYRTAMVERLVELARRTA